MSLNPVTVEELLAEAGWLRKLAGRMARDASSADDLTQGALVTALEHPPESGRPLRPWLAGVLRNLARSGHRAEVRRGRREHDSARPEAQPACDDVLTQFEEQRRLVDLVASLDDPYRDVLLRRYFRGESVDDIARSTGRPAATIRSQLARGIEQLRTRHARAFGGDRSRSLTALGLASGLPIESLPQLLAPSAPLFWAGALAMKASSKIVLLGAASLLILAGLYVANRPQRLFERSERGSPEDVSLVHAEAPTSNSPALATPGTGQRTVLAASDIEDPPIAATNPDPRTGLALRAIDERGQPIAGAQVWFVARNGTPLELAPTEASDASGRIEFDVLRAATFRYGGRDVRMASLRLSAPGYAAQLWVEELPPGKLTELGDLVLKSGGSVAGRVVDADGRPVANADLVAVVGAQALESTLGNTFRMSAGVGDVGDHDTALRAKSDSDGSFLLSGVSVGSVTVGYRAPNQPWQTHEPVELAPRESLTGLELQLHRLDPQQLIEGRVLLPTGEPAAGATVLKRGFWAFWDENGVEADSEGRFSFVVGTAGGKLALGAFDKAGAYSPSKMLHAAGGERDVVLQLLPPRWLELLVRERGGDVLEKAWVNLIVTDMGVHADFLHTDASGECSALCPGQIFRLTVGHNGFHAQEHEGFDPNELPELLEIELVRKPMLRGRVLANGRPVDGASIRVLEHFSETAHVVYKGFPSRYMSQGVGATSDSAGNFSVEMDKSDSPGFALLVNADGYARKEVWLGKIDNLDDHQDIEVSLTAGGTLEGSVRVGSSRSLDGIVIAISRADSQPLDTRTDANGHFRFEHLTPGPWRVEDREGTPEGRSHSVEDAEDAPFRPNVTVFEGQSTRFDLDLRWQEDLQVTGHVHVGERSTEGWTATIRPRDEAALNEVLPTVPLDAQGRFMVPAIAGEASLVVCSTDATYPVVLEQRLEINAQTGPVEIDLAVGDLHLKGVGSGRMIRLELRAGEDRTFELELPAGLDGELQLRVPVGEYRVEAARLGAGAGRWKVLGRAEVADGSVGELVPFGDSR